MSYILIIVLSFGSGVNPGIATITEQFYTGDACDAALKNLMAGVGNRDAVKALSAGCYPKGKL